MSQCPIFSKIFALLSDNHHDEQPNNLIRKLGYGGTFRKFPSVLGIPFVHRGMDCLYVQRVHSPKVFEVWICLEKGSHESKDSPSWTATFLDDAHIMHTFLVCPKGIPVNDRKHLQDESLKLSKCLSIQAITSHATRDRWGNSQHWANTRFILFAVLIVYSLRLQPSLR